MPKVTKPIIDIYLDYEIIADMANEYNNLPIEKVHKTWEEILRDAAAIHAAKQIIDRMNMRDVGGVYPEWALSDKDYQALKNLVKEK